ncbi:cbb3-type cytochrome oxidase assembly protein CcoS [Roseovarius sp. S4756]|uniref:cbb3-type cytochrome oxidase assembly protein CcoS n=1 Tax=Roseovarius maritimus TaxID=3342637 RepID=UPI00372C3D51
MSWLVLIPMSITMGLIGLAAFAWALRHDQFEDPIGNAERVLIPDPPLETKGDEDDDMATDPENGNARRGL